MESGTPEGDTAQARLTAERDRLEQSLRDLYEDLNRDGHISLTGDSAAETTAAAETLGLRDSLLEQISEVDAALRRLDDGTYGIDEVTGEPIDPERLEAEPTARTNVS